MAIGVKLTKDYINNKLAIAHNGEVRLIGEYVNIKSKTLFCHSVYGEWISTVDKVLNCRHSHPNKPKKSTKIMDRVCTRCNANKTTSKWHANSTCHNCYCKEYNRVSMSVSNKIAMRMRKRLWSALKTNVKADKTFNLVGCSTEHLIQYLESKFLPGMSWDNYGKSGWHVDHIKPLALFDLSDKAQQNLAFHYTNLQPLWWRDNLSKGDKYENQE